MNFIFLLLAGMLFSNNLLASSGRLSNQHVYTNTTPQKLEPASFEDFSATFPDIRLEAGTISSFEYQTAGIYWLPDYVSKNSSYGYSKRTNDDKPSGDTKKSCSDYGYDACRSPRKLRQGAKPVHPVMGLDCYDKSDCICPPEYKYTSTNCYHIINGTRISAVGSDKCNGKSNSCDDTRHLKYYGVKNGKPCGAVLSCSQCPTNTKPYNDYSLYFYNGPDGIQKVNYCRCDNSAFPLTVKINNAVCTICTDTNKISSYDCTCNEGYKCSSSESSSGSCKEECICNKGEGWESASDGRCLEKKCPEGYSAGLKDCGQKLHPESWTYNKNMKSGDKECGICTPKDCPVGYTAGVTKCSDGELSTSGYSGDNLCGKCRCTSCDDLISEKPLNSHFVTEACTTCGAAVERKKTWACDTGFYKVYAQKEYDKPVKTSGQAICVNKCMNELVRSMIKYGFGYNIIGNGKILLHEIGEGYSHPLLKSRYQYILSDDITAQELSEIPISSRITSANNSSSYILDKTQCPVTMQKIIFTNNSPENLTYMMEDIYLDFTSLTSPKTFLIDGSQAKGALYGTSLPRDNMILWSRVLPITEAIIPTIKLSSVYTKLLNLYEKTNREEDPHLINFNFDLVNQSYLYAKHVDGTNVTLDHSYNKFINSVKLDNSFLFVDSNSLINMFYNEIEAKNNSFVLVRWSGIINSLNLNNSTLIVRNTYEKNNPSKIKNFAATSSTVCLMPEVFYDAKVTDHVSLFPSIREGFLNQSTGPLCIDKDNAANLNELENKLSYNQQCKNLFWKTNRCYFEYHNKFETASLHGFDDNGVISDYAKEVTFKYYPEYK